MIAAGLVAAVSALACIAATARNPVWAFYMLPFRAWELLIGCVIAASPRSVGPGRIATSLQCFGMALVAGSIIWLRPGGFPGWQAALPVLGTACVIAPRRNEQGWIERMLSMRSLVWLGKVSFALYLWHWPVFSILDYWLYDWSSAARISMRALLAVVAGVSGYYLLEQPARGWLNGGGRFRQAMLVYAVGVLVLCGAGLWVRLHNYGGVTVPIERVASGGYQQQSSASDRIVSLLGDSNAGMYGRVLLEISEELSVDCQIVSVHSTNPLPGSALWHQYVALMAQRHPDVVVYVASWGHSDGKIQELVRDAVRELLSHCRAVILVCKPPVLPRSGSREWIREFGHSSPLIEDESDRESRQIGNNAVRSQASDRVWVVEVDDIFFADDGSIRPTDPDGVWYFYDRFHLSYRGASAVAPRIRDALKAALSRIDPGQEAVSTTDSSIR